MNENSALPALPWTTVSGEFEFDGSTSMDRGQGDDADHDDGTCFAISGIPATFSVHTREGSLPEGRYDVQVESRPPGEYIFTDVVSLDGFLELVAQIAGPEQGWPTSSG